jgi:hypothetical protein
MKKDFGTNSRWDNNYFLKYFLFENTLKLYIFLTSAYQNNNKIKNNNLIFFKIMVISEKTNTLFKNGFLILFEA